MVGFGANRRGGRLPSVILIFLVVVIAVLSYNYWIVSKRHGRLLEELLEAHTQAKRTDDARSRLEKRNSELMMQVDSHKKQIDQREGDYSILENKLQARELLVKKCNDEKMKLLGDVSDQMTEIQRLKEQLKELKQEFIKQEEQLKEVKKNSTTLERKLEYDSLQCGRQITQLKVEYEEAKKALEEQASHKRLVPVENRSGPETGRHREKLPGGGEGDAHATQQHDGRDLKEMGKPGSDAGMPGIEDSEVGKTEDMQFALKKPSVTRNVVPGINVKPKFGIADGPEAQRLSLDQPKLQHHKMEDKVAAPADHVKQVSKAVVFEENNKIDIKADEFGEQQRQLKAPDNVKEGNDGVKEDDESMKEDDEEIKGLPLPPNPAQVPSPIQRHQVKDHVRPEPVHHRQSRFFDENESPVDPQHGSKLADYNGDDGNVGEYEADKQAELAYNEEEDGDGGEEDVQGEPGRGLDFMSRCVSTIPPLLPTSLTPSIHPCAAATNLHLSQQFQPLEWLTVPRGLSLDISELHIRE
ncbi:protein CASC4 isoform X2 [Thalassophryne amazonica]|uniref:protein CASC4 isoform X2 n=1 Tax=Thalassophryne amazonica TaxID=390379 RepID=UPI00147100F9|nr:protein CASC4 isoform X2 [Thalassophryne amazonica]